MKLKKTPWPPLIVLVGPTASGKTSLAIELAKKFNGEIICADSRTVYKDMTIGTAKPTLEEMAGIPHWGLDLIPPNEQFTVVDFKKYAEQKIFEIRERNHVPLLVGGTGLYVDAVIYNYQFGPPADPALRKELEGMSLDELQKYCHSHDVELPENSQNKRYVIRAIERKSQPLSRRKEPIPGSIVVGILTDREVLHENIKARAEHIFDRGVVDEAIMLGKKYGWDTEAMSGNVYPLIREYMEGAYGLESLKYKFTTMDKRLAKRQMTWLRRNNKYIKWLPKEDVSSYLHTKLAPEL